MNKTVSLMIKLKHLVLSFIFLSFCLPAKSQTDCSSGEKKVVIQIKTDEFAFENSFVLRNSAGDTILEKKFFIWGDSLHTDSICVDADECLTLGIKDRGQNGLCCNSLKEGYYKVFIDNELRAEGAEFGGYEFIYFDCGSGAYCEDATPIDPGTHITPVGNGANWYEFVPDTSGLFKISTCFPENTCNTTIWAYDYCNPLNEFSTIQGSLFFGDDDCDDNLAETNARMLKGNNYFFRIGSATDDCRQVPIKWNLEFLRAEMGCMDSLACNFNPTATLDDGSCIFAGSPDCPDGPDLVMGQRAFEVSMRRDIINNPNSCLRDEGCLRGYGPRTVIRFDTEISNVGEKDFFIGSPPADISQQSVQWEFDECHNHWHYEGYARYVLFDENGTEIPIGFKNGFCVLDLECPSVDMEKYTCEVQGLSVGCKDIYDYYLDCQWIDITDVPDGKYTLVSVVNWDLSPDATGSFESDYSNNWAQVCIEIFRDTALNYIGYQVIPDCETYVDCLGIPNGTALPDCEGNCNGSIKKGDIIRDGERDLSDVTEYVLQSLDDSNDATECNDLNFDGKINVSDAALILECYLHDGNAPLPGHSHAPCEFTFSIENQFDSVWLKIGNIDLADEFVDIEYRAPYGKPEAFEFELKGLKIRSVLSLVPDFNATIEHDATEILGLSYEEKSLEKTTIFQPFLRVFFDELNGDSICIDNVEAILNENLEIMYFAGADCKYLDNSSTKTIPRNDFYSGVIPNPINDTGQLIFDNKKNDAVRLDFYSLSGKLLRTEAGFRGSSYIIDGKNLPSGILLYRIVKKDGISVGRIVIE